MFQPLELALVQFPCTPSGVLQPSIQERRQVNVCEAQLQTSYPPEIARGASVDPREEVCLGREAERALVERGLRFSIDEAASSQQREVAGRKQGVLVDTDAEL